MKLPKNSLLAKSIPAKEEYLGLEVEFGAMMI
jgi:hypothetical protein